MIISEKQNYTGMGLAVLATMIWSGNFIVARGVIHQIPPVSLAFFRWTTATVILAPFAWSGVKREWPQLKHHWKYWLLISIFGITLYNTLIYVAGRYLPAVNLALIGTTSSPVMSILLAALILKEKISAFRIAGLVMCITGILILLSQGSWERLIRFHFSPGDWWILLAALCFAIYNILVRKKPAGASPLSFLFITFLMGTLMLIPAYIWEQAVTEPVQWSPSLALTIGYLGLGNSVLSFLFWNASIARLGAGRTALFGNLIPIFSSLEAVWILREPITSIHIISGILVIGGLLVANWMKK